MEEHVALYIRVSTDAQREEGYSIDAQKEALIGYCMSRHWKNYELFIDGGYTGSNLDRPQMKRLIEAAKEQTITHCVVYKLDRLSRSQKDTLYLIEDVFNPNGVGFISLSETMDTSTPLGRLMLGILSAFAQLERENIKERTRMGMLERVREGYWMGGGKVPFGYDYDAENGILVPNEDAKTVREIYKLYLEGYSAQRIADMMGLKYEKLVQQILERKSNIGIISFRGVDYKGRHEPLIDEDTFYAARAERLKRSTHPVRTSENLLTGLLHCGICGARMHYQNWGKDGKKKIVCYSQQKTKQYLVHDENCPQKKFWKEDIEEIVLKQLFSFTMQVKESDEQLSKDSVLFRMKEEKAKQEMKLSRLYDLYSEDGNDILLSSIKKIKNELNKITEQILLKEKEEAGVKNRKAVIEKIEHLDEIWDELTVTEQKSILHELIDKIVIGKNEITISYLI